MNEVDQRERHGGKHKFKKQEWKRQVPSDPWCGTALLKRDEHPNQDTLCYPYPRFPQCVLPVMLGSIPTDWLDCLFLKFIYIEPYNWHSFVSGSFLK